MVDREIKETELAEFLRDRVSDQVYCRGGDDINDQCVDGDIDFVKLACQVMRFCGLK